MTPAPRDISSSDERLPVVKDVGDSLIDIVDFDVARTRPRLNPVQLLSASREGQLNEDEALGVIPSHEERDHLVLSISVERCQRKVQSGERIRIKSGPDARARRR